MRYAIIIFSVGALLGIGVFMVGISRLERALLVPASGAAVERVVEIPEKADLQSVVSMLREAGLVVDEGWLSLYADRLAAERPLVAGEYALTSEMSPIVQLQRISRGEVTVHAVDVRAGDTARDVVRALDAAGLGARAALEAGLADPALLAGLGVEAQTLEGFLLPDVYTFPRGLEAEEIYAKMVQRFATFLAERGPSSKPLYDVARVASLIQVSDVQPREWRVYAALLYNRLDKRVPLRIEKSAAYGLAHGHAAKDNPYDTGRPGLPPTPVCNPGPEAWAAALAPARSDALYQVRREDGSHFYCPDLECKRAAERARQGLPPELPPVLPPPAPIVDPAPRAPAEPLVVPGTPLDPEPPSEVEPLDGEQPL